MRCVKVIVVEFPVDVHSKTKVSCVGLFSCEHYMMRLMFSDSC